MGIQRVPNLLRWTVLACCLPYPGDPKSAIDCFFLFGISLHPGVTGSAPHWKFRGCRVHSFPSPQELLRPASWLALLSRTFTFELAPTRSPSISVEYDYVDKQSIPTAGLSPASPTALWAAGHRIVPDTELSLTPNCPADTELSWRGLQPSPTSVDSIRSTETSIGSSVFKCKTSRIGPSGPWPSGGCARSSSRSLATPDSSPGSIGPTDSSLTSVHRYAW